MAAKETAKYIEAVGRRKSAQARVRIVESKAALYDINGRTLSEYFPTKAEQQVVESALSKAELSTAFSISAKVRGGGLKAQAEAVRHGIARALVTLDQKLRVPLKHEGFLKRDPRVKERRKFGLKKARRAPQWSKR